MGEKISLALNTRELHGKKVIKLRREGLTPGVVYGPGIEPISVQAPSNVMAKVVADAGKHAPIALDIDGKKHLAMIKDVEFDPVRSQIRHISFHAVNAKSHVETELAIHLTGQGESPAERAGLVVLQTIEKVEVRALPGDLPEALEVSIVGLEKPGDHITMGDVVLPKGVELVTHDDGRADEDDGEEKPSFTDLVVASVYEPGALQAANEAAGGDATEETEVAVETADEATTE